MEERRSASRPSVRLGRRLLAGSVASVSLLATLALAPAAEAQGEATAVHTSIVSDKPAALTPAVKDGTVQSVVQVGNTIVIGGTFTQLVKAGGTQTYTRTGLAAFDATTGAVSTTFNPVLNGEVTSLEVSADGTAVYAGGAFNTVNGVTRKKVALIKLSDGSVVTAFKAKGVSSGVADLRRVGNTLWIAGQFATVDTKARRALATLNATTGALTDQSTLVFAGLHNGGSTNIRELAVTPDQSKLLVIGNFTTVNGSTRDQVALLDIGGATAALSGWQTSFFSSVCASAFDTFMRDVAISPDGTYAVFATTGAYRPNTSCDTTTRFEITGTSPGVTPTWVNMTGGDTTTAVAIVGSVIYTGGHFRWQNNSSAGDRAGQGAVARTGLAALNPVNGMPFAWNPTRERGYGVYDFLATPTGLWVGSDTDLVGDLLGADGLPGQDGVADGYHPRIAFFPLSGGTSVPADKVGSLPGDVLGVSPGATTSTAISSTVVNAAALPAGTTTMTSSDTWGEARGAMLVDNTLFTAWSNRLLYASPVNGSTVGARTQVNLSPGPVCTSASSQSGNICSGNPFSVDVQTITGMFYDAGRMYYTMSNSSSLYYRYFESQGGVVGSVRYTATGGVATLNPSRVRGMFLAGGQLYFADNNSAGRLTSIAFSGGAVGTTLTVVDTSRDWRARGLALRGAPPGNQAPDADIDASCGFLACHFDSTGSSDSDGTIASRLWDFGDGQTSTQSVVDHTYAGAGTYAVTLTVTDDDGAPSTAEYSAVVAPAPADVIAFRGSASASAVSGAAKVTVPGGVLPGDTMLLFVTLNGSTQTATPGGWEQVAERTDGTPDMVTRVFRRTALAGDAGTLVSVGVTGTFKSVATLLAYSGVDTANPLVLASQAEPSNAFAHAAPNVAVSTPASWVVSYWADKASDVAGWSVPGGLSVHDIVIPTTTSGRVSSASADSGAAVPTGTWTGAAATGLATTGKATSFSIVLPPA